MTQIGLISDTHLRNPQSSLPQVILDAFRGVDLILHCGDIEHLRALDELEQVAPVLAVRGYPDPREPGERLAEVTRVVKVEGLFIGMIHDIGWPGPPIRFVRTLEIPATPPLQELLRLKFGQRVDLVAFGDTHEEFIGLYEGVLFVNPGSATCPGIRHPEGELGTVAILDVRNGVVSAEIKKLPGTLPPGWWIS